MVSKWWLCFIMSGDYSIYDSSNYYCLNCTGKTLINGRFVCGCSEGTIKNPLNEKCYLPEDPEIKQLLLDNPKLQCYRNDGITLNYCNNEGHWNLK